MGLATANSGANVITGTGTAGSGGSIGSGEASATGNESLTEIEQYADILGMDQSTVNVTQQATVLNVGFALANSGLNDVSGVASGLLTASEADDDAVAQELFAMLLPALLQSYGYGPAQGSINSGNATAVGNDSETFVRQVAMAAASGDGQVDIVQDVLVANMGAAGANTGGNTLGSVHTIDLETANAVVMMAAFMSELLAQVHHSANDTAFQARSQGIEIPFQGLILRLDGAFEGLDTEVSQGGAQANLRQVSVVVSLGIANANTGGNITSSEVQQGNSVNRLQAGDALAVLALDENGNVIGSGDAQAGNNDVVVVSCQRLNAEDVDCLAPPTTTTPVVSDAHVTRRRIRRSRQRACRRQPARRLPARQHSTAERSQRFRSRSVGNASGDRLASCHTVGARRDRRPDRWCTAAGDEQEELSMIAAVVLAALSLVGTVPPSSEPKPIPTGYAPLVDDTDTIVLAVPATWTDVDTSPAPNLNGSPRPTIGASPDIASFLDSFDTPGVLYTAFPFELNPVELLEDYALTGGCETIEFKTYEDPVFTGVVQVGTNCGPAAMTWNMVVASPLDRSLTAVVQIQTTEPEELETVLLTFNTVSNTSTSQPG